MSVRDFSFCASRRSRNHMNMSQEPFYSEIYKENAGRESRGHRFVRACALEMDMDISQEPFGIKIYRENAVRDDHGHRFVRVCAVEMHMDISQEPFCLEIYRDLAGHG